MPTIKKILIAEDEKPLANAMQLKLKNAGYEAFVANDGELAINELKKGDYDMLFLDLMMPKVDGFAVLEYAKENKIKTAIVVLSNLSQTDDEQKARKLGAVDFFVKSDTPISNIVKFVKEYSK